MKKKKVCDICKKKTKTLIRFEDDRVGKELAVCSSCYSELSDRGLPKWVEVPVRTNIYGGEHRP